MAPTDLHSRSYMVILDEGVAAKARIVICEVERTKLEVKRFSVWAYCGYPAEIEDISDQLNGQVERKLRQHAMQLMADGGVLYAGEIIPVNEIGGSLQRERDIIVAADKDPKRATVIVRADGRANAGDVQRVIQICQELGFQQFALRALYKPD